MTDIYTRAATNISPHSTSSKNLPQLPPPLLHTRLSPKRYPNCISGAFLKPKPLCNRRSPSTPTLPTRLRISSY